MLQTNSIANSKPLSLYLLFCFQISNVNCLDETTIHVDAILYLSL